MNSIVIDLEGWKVDKARRDARRHKHQCPMCGKAKREKDEYCSDACWRDQHKGLASIP